MIFLRDLKDNGYLMKSVVHVLVLKRQKRVHMVLKEVIGLFG